LRLFAADHWRINQAAKKRRIPERPYAHTVRNERTEGFTTKIAKDTKI